VVRRRSSRPKLGKRVCMAECRGMRSARPVEVEFGEDRVFDSDGLVWMRGVPGSMVVVGVGVIGIEYVSMFAALGARVSVVEKHPWMLEFCDLEVVESREFHLRDRVVMFRFGEEGPRSGSSLAE
jgi:NAD(P) transhydrogenase